MDNENIISEVFLFSSFDKKDVEGLLKFCRKITFKKDEQVFGENDKAKSFYVVISGEVKVYKVSLKGQEQILHVHGKGDVVAEASMFDLETYPANCQATCDSTLIEVKSDMFKNYIMKNPDLSFKLLKSYSQRLREFVKLIHSLSLQDVKGRLAQHILSNAKKTGKDFIYEESKSKKELASLIGTIPESISRTLHLFKSSGCIKEENKKIFIVDKELLKSYLS